MTISYTEKKKNKPSIAYPVHQSKIVREMFHKSEIHLFFCFLLACGSNFTSVNGSFTSPGYPNNYPNSANCHYEIRVPSDKRIVLTFDVFSLESGYDKLKLTQLRSGSMAHVDVLTGSGVAGRIFYSAENVFILVFTSDGSVTRTGFVARYYSGRSCSIIFGGKK